MGVKLVSSSGGSVEINPPTTASNFIATMPAGTGNVVVNGINSAVAAATAVASTSGTSIDFTSIPSWVKRITVMFQGVSTSGSSNIQIQIGSGSITSSSYVGSGSFVSSGTTGAANLTSGFAVSLSVASGNTYQGVATICLIGSNTWAYSGIYGRGDAAATYYAGGVSPALGGTLDRVRITTVGGTDTFDAGSINILYE
jgi:hypothetical protein